MNIDRQDLGRLVARRNTLVARLREIPTGRGVDVDGIKAQIDRLNGQICRMSCSPALAGRKVS